ncbi:type IV pilus assembly protein FimV [Vreelandella sp. V005]|uniref:type IV pilus assembly protein FimV n=1 Tax=Vreelandella sp. V005 TaxID=3459608 RepID=UPI0040445448
MKKTLTWITWLSLSAVSPFALAVGLGQASVGSYLNAPLNASIPLLNSGGYAIDELRVSVAEPADFAAAGLEWTPLAASVRAQVVEQQGQRQVRLSSGQTMQEPWLDLLLAVEFPDGQQLRDVTLLFDPPGYSQQSQAQTAAPVASYAASTAPSEASTVPPASSNAREQGRENSSANSLNNNRNNSRNSNSGAYVGSGDTLWSVAERTKPDEVSVQQMMVALLEANPDVFPSGNINDMRAGQTLRVPDRERVMARSHSDADAAIQAMNEAWRARRNGTPQAVPLPGIEADIISDSAIAASTALEEPALEESDAPEPDNALAAGGAELSEPAADEAATGDQVALAAAADEPEALTQAELTEQLRLSQAMLQQVLDERELMRAELNALRVEVASLNQALSEALAAQAQSPETDPQPLAASMEENQSVAAFVERYQWPLALAGIALLLALLVWLRKRRENNWEDVPPLAEPVVNPTVSPRAATTAAPTSTPVPEAMPFTATYPIHANEENISAPVSKSEPPTSNDASPDIAYPNTVSASDTDQWLLDEHEQTIERDGTPSYETSYEKSQAAGLAEQGRQRRLGLHVAPTNGAEQISLAPPPSPEPMRDMLAALAGSSDVPLGEPTALNNATQHNAIQPSAPDHLSPTEAEHRFIDYHPPTLTKPVSSHAGLRHETPQQPTVDFATESPSAPAKKKRRLPEDEWEIEEVAFKPRGLDNSEPSKSSK